MTEIAKIQKVKDFLPNQQLAIPHYQRPYKWQSQHINHLLDDILTHQNQSAYRLGSVIIHHDTTTMNTRMNIVDGQQRTITLILIMKAFAKKFGLSKFGLSTTNSTSEKNSLSTPNLEIFQQVVAKLPTFEFNHPLSIANIQQNFQLIQRTINKAEFDEKVLSFMLNHCEFVIIELNDISEAFQFFDSQNARGKDLSPHDLLKAFHLREFSPTESNLKAKTVAHWENSNSKQLAQLFAYYLYRIRGWINGKPSRHFSKADVDLFKGVNLDRDNAPFVQQMQITHRTVDEYNADFSRMLDIQPLSYPFQLDQTIINGRRFFEMIEHYQGFRFLFSDDTLSERLNGNVELSDNAKKIMEKIDSYEGKNRVGDGHTRNLFNCLLMYYYDKFADAELSSAIEKIFIWAYSIRLKQASVSFATIDNYVVKENNLFQQLRVAMRPSDFLHISLPVLTSVESTKTGKLEELFKKMGYLHQN